MPGTELHLFDLAILLSAALLMRLASPDLARELSLPSILLSPTKATLRCELDEATLPDRPHNRLHDRFQGLNPLGTSKLPPHMCHPMTQRSLARSCIPSVDLAGTRDLFSWTSTCEKFVGWVVTKLDSKPPITHVKAITIQGLWTTSERLDSGRNIRTESCI